MDKKPAFLSMQAPANHVAGLGRGATGFTTRSDIGPARTAGDAPEKAEGYAPGRGRGVVGFGNQQQQASAAPPVPAAFIKETDDAAYNDAKFDPWSGFNDSGLFNKGTLDADDEEAEKVWQEVDEKMDSRRKRRREEKEQEVLERYRLNNLKLSAQFADVKEKLSNVSEQEWSEIPDIGDYSIKRRKFDHYTPVPDTLLERAMQENQRVTALPANVQAGLATPNLGAFGEARESIVMNQLKKVEDSVTGKTTVDPKRYMDGLSTVTLLGETEITDLKKARELFKNLTESNPSNARGWISRARVEELAGKMAAARNIITQGCDACPEHESVWLEAARLQTPENAKHILAQAVQKIPKSVNVWIQAAKLEIQVKAKRIVIRKALEIIPNSEELWKQAISLEDEDDARILLARAVDCIPTCVDFWLALARLESYIKAKQVLNKAVKTLPTEARIWIAAAQLEEANGNKNVENIIKKAIQSMQSNQMEIKRDDWMHHAYKAEDDDHLETCRAIVRVIIGIGIEDQARKHIWLKDAQIAANVDPETQKQHPETARAIFAHALSIFPEKKSIWRRAAEFEKLFGNTDSLLTLLRKAVEIVPKAEELWLMAAKEKYKAGDIDGAREILKMSFSANQDSEEIWLAATKIELESNFVEKARILLQQARQHANTARVWMKSAILERNVGNRKEEKVILDNALEKFVDYPKLWIMRGQWEEACGSKDAARAMYVKGIKNCPDSVPLWKCAVKLEAEQGNFTKARALLDKARLKNTKNAELWRTTVRIELRAAAEDAKQKSGIMDDSLAKKSLASGMQECPNAGILWAESIEMEPRPKQQAQSILALRSCDKDAHVLTAVAQHFWRSRAVDNARKWFERALHVDSDLGDAWILYYKFELEYGNAETQKAVFARCEAAEPKHGELWTSISKQIANSKMRTKDILKQATTSIAVAIPRYINYL